MHGVFHTSLLSSYKRILQFCSNFIPQSSKLIEEEEEYEMDTICAHWGSPSRPQYLVSWRGFFHPEDT